MSESVDHEVRAAMREARLFGERFFPGLTGCDVPGHPNFYAHDCESWDEAAAKVAHWRLPEH